MDAYILNLTDYTQLLNNSFFVSALQIERIAKLRNQKRQESRQGKSLSSDRRSDDNGVFGAKSKRIGKVVIKLRNGKKLVVKKRRKLTSDFIKPTTQKPVLVTVKSRGSGLKKKSKISSRPKTQQFVSSRPNDIFNSEEGTNNTKPCSLSVIIQLYCVQMWG